MDASSMDEQENEDTEDPGVVEGLVGEAYSTAGT